IILKVAKYPPIHRISYKRFKLLICKLNKLQTYCKRWLFLRISLLKVAKLPAMVAIFPGLLNTIKALIFIDKLSNELFNRWLNMRPCAAKVAK
ncbi:hypothetical protein, partial [Methylicorpusculum sp.]|uniref:hypothetical protein n=1 Tax=Methylicorpusculum sp. TaxID=2713644 RepID=UPI002ABA9480